MDYSECLEFEIVDKSATRIFIAEENVKGKRTNRDFKIGKSFQYSSPSFGNRFLIWKMDNNLLSISEWSTEVELLGNRIEIEFEKSQVLLVNVFETEQDEIQFLVTTSLMVMKFSLHHPRKLRHPNSDSFQYSIFYGLSELNEQKYFVTAYFNANEITAVNSTIDRITSSNSGTSIGSGSAFFNYGLSNGSIFTFIIEELIYRESVHYFEMKESSLLSKLWSGIMSRPKSNDYINTSISDLTYVEINQQIYVVSISRDNKLKLWSLKDHCFVMGEDLLEYALESNHKSDVSIINYNSIISSHRIKSFFQSDEIRIFTDTVLVYFHVVVGQLSLSNWITIQIADRQSMHVLSNIVQQVDEGASNLIDFEVGYNVAKKDKIGVWRLMSQSSMDAGDANYSMDWMSLFQDIDSNSGNKGQNTDRILFTCRLSNGSSAELDLHVESHQDPQEAIVDRIFTPGKFLRSAIVNTLNRYLQGYGNEGEDSRLLINTNIDELKRAMVHIIELSVERELLVYLNEEEEFDVIELNRKQWFAMLKQIVEEHYRLMEPQGIIRVAGTVGLCRYGTVSLMRSANELVERTVSSLSINDSLYRFYDQSSIVSGTTLLRYLNDLSVNIQRSNLWPMIENRISRLELKSEDIVPVLSFTVPSVIDSRLDSDQYIIDSTVQLLSSLDMMVVGKSGRSQIIVDDLSTEEHGRTSSFSLGLLHYSLCQLVRDRITLLLAFIALLHHREKSHLKTNDQKLQNHRLECSLKSFASLYWLLTVRQKSSSTTSASCSELTDSQKSQLESLNLLENRCPDPMIGATDILCFSVLKSMRNRLSSTFFNTNSHSLVYGDERVGGQGGENWQRKIISQMSAIIDKLNPQSDQFCLVQVCRYFLSYNLPLELIDFLKFLKASPSEVGDEMMGFVDIVIGVAYLLLNKFWKAIDCFTDAIDRFDISSSKLVCEIFFEKEVTDRGSRQHAVVINKDKTTKTIDFDECRLALVKAKLILKLIETMSNLATGNPEPYSVALSQVGEKIIDRALKTLETLRLPPLFCNVDNQNSMAMVIDDNDEAMSRCRRHGADGTLQPIDAAINSDDHCQNDVAVAVEQLYQQLNQCKSNLMNVLFKNLLDLARYKEARDAIVKNPDSQKQQNCLREFISTMFDHDQLDLLVQFDYGDLGPELVNVLYCRARAASLTPDVTQPDTTFTSAANQTMGTVKLSSTCSAVTNYESYYSVLFSYFCSKRQHKRPGAEWRDDTSDYKAAATCMLELALRLDQDLRNRGIYMSNRVAIDHLQAQVKAYLACITTASLIRDTTSDVDSVDQLFVFPSSIASEFDEEASSNTVRAPAMTEIETEAESTARKRRKQRPPVFGKKANYCFGLEEGEECGERVDDEDGKWRDEKEVSSKTGENYRLRDDDSCEDQGQLRIIINLDQIRRQYNLIRTRLKVLRDSPEHGFIQSGKLAKSLTLSSLMQMGLYWDAITLCTDFKMDLGSIASSLASRCASEISKSNNNSNDLDGNNLALKEKENIIDSLEELNCQVDYASQSGGVFGGSGAGGSLQKLLWKLLEQFLLRYDTTANGDLATKACARLLSGGVELLPTWLIDFVVDKKQATGALLRLYVLNGYMEPSIGLVSRLLDSEIDNLYLMQEMCLDRPKSSLFKEPQPKWICYSDIFNLLEILAKMSETNPKAQEFHQLLEEKMRVMVSLGKENVLFPAIE